MNKFAEDNIDGPVCSRCHADIPQSLMLVEGKWICEKCLWPELHKPYPDEEEEQDI